MKISKNAPKLVFTRKYQCRHSRKQTKFCQHLLKLETTLHLSSYGRAGCEGCAWDALVERVLLRVRSGAVRPASPAEGDGRRVSDVKITISKILRCGALVDSRKEMFNFDAELFFEMIICNICILLQRSRLTSIFWATCRQT